VVEETVGFDSFELKLGDMMRGERATMGKSLLDVQRELKIKAAYIAAIENSDPTAFDTPGFIAGYVRSYARYLKMDPEWAYATFCEESGFSTAHGMSAEASAAKPSTGAARQQPAARDIFASSATPFLPEGEPMFGRLEPGAVGSVLVLAGLLVGLGYGGWSVLQEVQRVQFAPVEQTPTVVSDLDPLAGAANIAPQIEDVADLQTPSVEALDRLYRPQALDVPVLVSRDGPIASLNPSSFGALVPDPALAEVVEFASADTAADYVVDSALQAALDEALVPTTPQVTETPAPAVQMVAVRPAWVRVRSADGSVIFEATMKPGDTYTVPQTENPATLRVGESGAVYFAVNGIHYGPAGPRGQVTSNLAMSVDNLTASYQVADLTADTALAEVVRVAQLQSEPALLDEAPTE